MRAQVAFVLPTSFPVTSVTLNYAGVAVAIVLLGAVLIWVLPVVGARNWYRGGLQTYVPEQDAVRMQEPSGFRDHELRMPLVPEYALRCMQAPLPAGRCCVCSMGCWRRRSLACLPAYCLPHTTVNDPSAHGAAGPAHGLLSSSLGQTRRTQAGVGDFCW